MFRNEAQQVAAVRILLRSVRLEHLWQDNGPTDHANQLIDHKGGAMSHGETLMLQVAFDFWNGWGLAKFADVVNDLDGTRLPLVANLMIAVGQGAEAVDQWIADYGDPPASQPRPRR